MNKMCFLLVAVVFLSACSKKSADTPPNDGNIHNVTTNGLPFEVSVVTTDQAKEWDTLVKLSLGYFEKQDYDALEKLAGEGRSAEDAWPEGDWKVVPVYVGLELADDQADSAWLARQKALEAWGQARPESITARVALARHLVNYAWKARGGGYANTVSDAAERLFEERLHQAALVLNEAKALKEKCPVYWTTIMKIARGLGVTKEQFDHIFQEAIQAYPDYAPIYIQRGTFLLPRWYGEGDEWVADLSKTADKLGGARGDIIYAQTAWALKGYSDKKNIFEDYTNLSWERIDRGWTALEKKDSDSLEAIHIHAHMAGLAGDGPAARKYLMKTGGKVTLNAWVSKGEFIDFANWAIAQ
jgi:hypothetical protein